MLSGYSRIRPCPVSRREPSRVAGRRGSRVACRVSSLQCSRASSRLMPARLRGSLIDAAASALIARSRPCCRGVHGYVRVLLSQMPFSLNECTKSAKPISVLRFVISDASLTSPQAAVRCICGVVVFSCENEQQWCSRRRDGRERRDDADVHHLSHRRGVSYW